MTIWAKQRNPVMLLGVLILFICVALAGTIATAWWDTPVWRHPENGAMFAAFATISLLAYFGMLAAGLPMILPFAIPVALYVAIAGIGPFAAVIWIWICCSLLGSYLAAFGSSGGQADQPWSLRNAALGFCAVGLSINGLALAGVCTPLVVFFLISAYPLFWAFKTSRQGGLPLPSVMMWFRRSRPRPLSESAVGAVTLLGITLVLFVTVLPDVGHDALSFHLNVPFQVVKTGAWHFDVTKYIWAVMPFGADWLLVPPYVLADEQGARLMTSSMLLAVAYGGYGVLRDRVGPMLALALPALLLTLPLSLLEVATTFIEAPLAFFLLIAFAELCRTTRRGQWAVLAVFAGFACSVKLISLLVLPFIFIGALYQMRDQQFERLTARVLFQAMLLFLLFAAPPYVVAWIRTGNPVFPFFNTLFRSPLFDTVTAFTNLRFVRPISVGTWWEMSIDSRWYGEFDGQQGALGIAILVLTPFALVVGVVRRNWKMLACICATLAYLVLCFYNQAYLRYAFPVLPWLLIAGVWSLSALPAPRVTVTCVVLLLSLVQIWRFPVSYWVFQQFDLSLVTSRRALEDYFVKNKPEAVAGKILSSLEEMRGRRILILGLDPVFKDFPDDTIADSWHSWPYYQSSRDAEQLLPSIIRAKASVLVFPLERHYVFEREARELTTELFRVGKVVVGAVDRKLLYSVEQLRGPDLTGAVTDWQMHGATPAPGGVITTVEHAVTQNISVGKIDDMLLTMTARCPPGQSFRSQINWYDATEHFIGTDIKVHECMPDSVTISRVVVRPALAVTGQVYGGSHDKETVLMQKISVRTYQ